MVTYHYGRGRNNMIKEKLVKSLKNTPDNYLYPFLWVHNEDDELLIREIEKVYQSGIKAVCIESRTHEEFGKDDWWSDMDIVFAECKKRGMDVWLLDDKHFPTGLANEKLFLPENSHLTKRKIHEIHTDVIGPAKDSAVIIDAALPKEATVRKIVAYKRKPDGLKLYNEYIDLTDKYEDGFVWFDVPEGSWQVFTIFDEPYNDYRIDGMNPQSTDLLIEAVYQPMYEHYSEYFGNIFKGFFSDEPYIMHGPVLPAKGDIRYRGFMPFNSLVEERLTEKWGEDALLQIPSLFYDVEGVSSNFRVLYMDTLSALYSENFCWRLGNWCRERNVAYIGHIIEDNSQDVRCSSGAHFFRALDGQDFAGIDLVLNQIVPGFSDISNAVSYAINIADNEFFHYELAKLGSSHAHIQPLKKGRAMCEIYGAYGWSEGIKMMKWIADHMIVRGINCFIPHAFSAITPDNDSPPHFYEGGEYPQFKEFKLLSEYYNRMCTLFNDGLHKCKAAVYYRAESDWAGGKVGHEKSVCKLLSDNQIDFDIIPLDYLLPANAGNSSIVVNNEEYPCLIVPKSEFIPKSAWDKMVYFAENGVKIIFAGGYPDFFCEGGKVTSDNENMVEISYDNLASYMRKNGLYDIELSTAHKDLRYYRYVHDDAEIYMFFNEDIRKACNTKVKLEGFSGGTYTEYDVLLNKAAKKHSDGEIELNIEPYNSTVIILGDVSVDLPESEEYKEQSRTKVSECYDISIAEGSEDYTFTPYKNKSKLFNFTSKEGIFNFGGHIKYDTDVNLTKNEDSRYFLNLEYVGDTAAVSVNGKDMGLKIVPPFNYDITDGLCDGENKISIEVSTHLGYKKKDTHSRFRILEPSGLMGNVEIVEMKKLAK